MRKLIKLFLFIVITIQLSFSSNHSKGVYDTLQEINPKLKQQEKQIANYQINNEKLIKINDSLRSELINSNIEKQNFSTFYSNQSNKYIFYTTILFAILAIGSYSIFKLEIRFLKKITDKQLAEQNKKFKSLKNKFLKIDNAINHSQSNINASIAIYMQEKDNYLRAGIYFLLSSKHNGLYREAESSKKDFKIKYEVVKNNLILARENFENLHSMEEIENLKDELQNINKLLNAIYLFKDEDIKLEVAQIKIIINGLINKD